MLEFFGAAAWARIVAPGFLKRGLCITLCDPLHDIRRRATASEFRGHEAHIRIDMVNEHLVACAKVIEAGFSLWSSGEPMLGTLAVAGKTHVALTAVFWQSGFFCLSKASLLI